MFKKSVLTDEISQDFETAVQLASKYGLDAVEIRSVWDKDAHELSREELLTIKNIADKNGLKISAISAPFFKCRLSSEEDYRLHLDILKQCIEASMLLDTNIIRGFTFWKDGDFEFHLDEIAARFQEPIQMLQKSGRILALEFDPSVFASNARLVAEVLKKVNSPWIKGLWDPGNDLFDPLHEDPFPEGYDHIKPYIIHVHLKDAKLENGAAQSVPLGSGDVDFKEIFHQLQEDDYDGYVTLETHYRPKHQISEELLALPKGSAFSFGGYEATEECLKNWESLI